MDKLINILLFNSMWLGCIYFGNAFTPLIFIWLIVHMIKSDHTKQECQYVATVVLIGVTVDSILMHTQVFSFTSDPIAITSQIGLIPFWLIAIWVSFALTLNSSLLFLEKHWSYQLFAGATMAPFSYFLGERLGAVTFNFPLQTTLLLLSILWSMLLVNFFALLQFYLRGHRDINEKAIG